MISIEIGQRNIEAVKTCLEELKLKIISEHVGGKMGRSMFVDLDTFDVKVRMVNRDEFVL